MDYKLDLHKKQLPATFKPDKQFAQSILIICDMCDYGLVSDICCYGMFCILEPTISSCNILCLLPNAQLACKI